MAEIAVAGAIAVLTQTISILGNLATEEGARLFKLKEDIAWIEREMRYIQTYLKLNDSLGEEHEDSVEAALVKDVTVLAYDVEDIVETYFPLISSESKKLTVLGKIKSTTFGFLKQKDAQLNFVKEIEGIKRRVEDIPRVRDTYGAKEVNDGKRTGMDIWEQRKLFLNLNESKIVVGFDEHIKTLVSKVFDPKSHHLPVISIVGMAGLGKTTLAKKVYNSVKDYFDCSAMVYVSQTPNIRQLLQEVAKQVGMGDEKCKENLEVNLLAHLEDKRYVIVFDDIWDSQVWDYLKICIPNNCNISGSKIIITSRNAKVGSLVGTVKSLYELEPLDEKDSWNLFCNLVINPLEITNVRSDFIELETIGRMIVEKCGGVPLAIEAIAGLLLGIETSENEWKEVFERMGQDDDDKCSRVLRLSYKDLPTELKPCFLYFGFFPEDSEISAEDLINIWVAEGFLQGKKDLEPEDVGWDYLNQLVARNMVQVSKRRFNGSIRTCRVHDLWHSFCITVAYETSFFNIDKSHHQNNNSKTIGIRRAIISYHTTREKNVCHGAAKLRAVLYCHHCTDDSDDEAEDSIGELFKGSNCLRVLMVEIDEPPLVLMEGIGSLINMKYIRFLESRRSLPWVGSISILPIGNLKSLLTLDLRNVSCMDFPDEIWQMKRLRHILLVGDKSRFAKSKRRSSHKREVALPNLQTLHVVPAHALEAEYLKGFANLRKLGIYEPTNSMMKVLSDMKPISHKLRSLKFTYEDCEISDETSSLDLSRYQNLCEFSLKFANCFFPRSREAMPPNLVKLKLTLDGGEEVDPMELLKSLPKLKILKLKVYAYNREEMVISGGPEAFPQLEVLELDPPDHVSFKFVVEEQAMPKLERLQYWIKQPRDLERLEIPERIRAKIFERKKH